MNHRILKWVLLTLSFAVVNLGCDPENAIEAVATPTIGIGVGQVAMNFDFTKAITFVSTTEGALFITQPMELLRQ